MGRMHSNGKGISKSALPYKRSPPSWLKVTASQVEDHVCKLAKKGLTPSQVFNNFKVSEMLLFIFICLLDWCHPERFQWYCPGEQRHRKQGPPHPQESWYD